MDAIKVIEQVKFKMPDPVFLTDGGILEKWVEQMERVGEAVLYPHWRTSIKMGGVLFRKIMEREPTNPDIKKMIEYGKAKKVAIGTPEDPKVISSSGSDPNSSSNPVPVKNEETEEKKKEREEKEEKEEKKKEKKRRRREKKRKKEGKKESKQASKQERRKKERRKQKSEGRRLCK
jgi:hypothetical protein